MMGVVVGCGEPPEGSTATVAERAAMAVLTHCRSLIERAGPACERIGEQDPPGGWLPGEAVVLGGRCAVDESREDSGRLRLE